MAKPKLHCCDDANKQLYRDYYATQRGGGMPIFAGRRYQRGHGIGQTLGGLFKRFVVPLVAPYAKNIGKKILGNVAKTGMQVVGDVMSGRNVKESLKHRGLSGIKRTVGDVINQKAPPPKKTRQTRKKKKRTPGSNDIFG